MAYLVQDFSSPEVILLTAELNRGELDPELNTIREADRRGTILTVRRLAKNLQPIEAQHPKPATEKSIGP